MVGLNDGADESHGEDFHDAGRWEEPDPADIVALPNRAAWSEFEQRYAPNRIPRPLQRCLEVARAAGARYAVVETRYIDLDYRSEYSAYFSKTFGNTPDSTHRIHFFRKKITADRLWRLSDAVRNSYLGYIIIRPTSLARVGRTVLTPPPELAAHTQCSVTDEISFFGQALTVTGVPFAQQDTQLGRCAQVTAWVCHYTAALRGDVQRRPMADFSLLADHTSAEGRPLPSQGLNGNQLSTLLREFDLPALLYRMGKLPWPEGMPTPPLPPQHAVDKDDPGTYDARVVPVVIRFLNSGYPVIIGTDEHAFALVGYRPVKRSGVTWTEFIRHDDQRGPYLLVEDVLNDVDPATRWPYGSWRMVLAPVPAKLWLAPETAERAGTDYLLAYDRKAGTGRIAERYERGLVAFQTLAISASDYKASLQRRGLTREMRELRLSRMSRMVLVTQAVDKDIAMDRPCVLGEIVFDATSSEQRPTALAMRVPGALFVRHSDGQFRTPLDAGVDPVHLLTSNDMRCR